MEFDANKLTSERYSEQIMLAFNKGAKPYNAVIPHVLGDWAMKYSH